MKTKLCAALLATISLSACATTPADAPAEPVTVQILAINDFHGNLETPQRVYSFEQDGEVRQVQLGGAAQLAATLAGLRQVNSITVAAGDLVGASPLISALFLDEPSIRALSGMGLDVASVGNHEFDRGTQELLRMQNGGCEQFTLREPCGVEPFAGAGFEYLAGNVVDDEGGTLFPGTAMREVDGARIGFIGLTLEGTPVLVSAQATAGYEFLDEAETANALAAGLRAQGADAVVLLIHEGAEVAGEYVLAGCPDLSGSIVPIVERLDPSISVVVSGHTHQAYVCSVPNAAGGETLLTSGGRYGGFVTDITMKVDPERDAVVSVSGTNTPVDGSAGSDTAIASLVAVYAEASGPVANRAVGTIKDTGEHGEDCSDDPSEDLTADAYLAAANAALPEPVDFAIVNSGGVRTDLSGANDGVLTYGELAAMAPFGNGVIVLEMTGAQIRTVLEQQFCNESPASICDSLLTPSHGVQYTFDRNRPANQRVQELLINREPLDSARTYRVVTNSFLAGGGDGFAQFSQVPEIANVGFDIDALEAYVAAGELTVPVCGRVRDLTPLS
ncbi:bifunctional metallophosphatase/5'-nucleotidase [Erythrobacter alti]|uniref:bifunctional metallophosphatase/5'-nucleotidase n=1 Tax=Erythrobacter alti TaxID=1896145 RepID=UPI0030F468A0